MLNLLEHKFVRYCTHAINHHTCLVATHFNFKPKERFCAFLYDNLKVKMKVFEQKPQWLMIQAWKLRTE